MARVKDLWKEPARKGKGKRWLAIWQDPAGKERSKAFAQKAPAERYAKQQEAAVEAGAYVDPARARITVGAWADEWLAGYAVHKPSTVRQAKVHMGRIRARFELVPLAAVKPSDIKAWCASLSAEGLADSYVYACHSRLSQLMTDAVHDGLIPRNPCSRRTSPGAGKQRPYVATTDQVWALHGALPERLSAAVLLGAFVGLRTAEACGLRVADVDFLRGIVHPTVQYPDAELKTEMSRTAVPIPRTLSELLAVHVKRWAAATVLTAEDGGQLGPWMLEREWRKARQAVEGLPTGFRFHDLRHYFASLLISSGADVKVVQHRLRHTSAKTTLDTYGHLWPDSDESTRAVVDAVLKSRTEQRRNTAVSR